MDDRVLILVCSVVLLISLVLIFSSPSLTGFAVEGSTGSNVSIVKFISISLSNNLADGITFGSVSALPAVNINSTDNYNGVSGESTMYINVSMDGNTAVDFCIKANSALTDSASGAVIGLGNETYHNSSTSNSLIPGPDTSSSMLTTAYVKASTATEKGEAVYYRLWLDVPSATSSGNYNNSISFKGVETTQVC